MDVREFAVIVAISLARELDSQKRLSCSGSADSGACIEWR